MKIQNLIRQASVSAIFFTSLSLVACSHAPPVQEFPETANAGDEVEKFDNDVRSARAEQVNVLAPKNFEDAHDALVDAKEAHQDGDEPQDVLHEVAVGRAYLDRANQMADVSRSTIGDVVEARRQAMEAGAHKDWKDDFADADDDFKDVTADIENNDLDDAREDRKELQAKYLDLELRSIKHANLGKARKTIRKAVDEGAEDFASQSLAQARKDLNDADAYITADRHSFAEISRVSGVADRSATHALRITRAAKKDRNASPEEVALRVEEEERKARESTAALQDERLNSAAMAGRNASFESDRRMNERLEAAQAAFTASEADVFRQGNKLTIRLKGMQFPTKRATIQGENFALLSKVEKVISEFDRPAVTVEGHTDSTGNKEANQLLSEERAAAVSKYLASKDDGDMEIKTVGYGYERPVASNKTPGGRAQNRRVDIVIAPDASHMQDADAPSDER